MNQYDGELSALSHQRKMESLGESPITGQVLDGAIELAQKCGLPSFVGNLFKKALSQGKLPVEKMVENLESAASEEIRRIWEQLDGQTKRQKEFETRLQSQEAQSAYLNAIFHGLRTSDPEKHSRLARLTINSVFENDLKPENLDDMMRAATELKDRDISVMKTLSETQCKTGTYYPLTSVDGTMNRPREVWQELEQNKFITLVNQMEIRSSLERLKALGFCAEIQTTDSNWHPRVLVTPFGEKFLLRLQEIVV
jgi:hypothetical protein